MTAIAPHTLRAIVPAAGNFPSVFFSAKPLGDHIALATSQDGKVFQRRLLPTGKVGMFSDGFGTRDPMTIRVNGMFYTYYSANPGTIFEASNSSALDRSSLHLMSNADLMRTSSDLLHWSDAKIVAEGGEAGTGSYSAECPFVYYHRKSDIIISSGRSTTARMPKPAFIDRKIPQTLVSTTIGTWLKRFRWRRRKLLNRMVNFISAPCCRT